MAATPTPRKAEATAAAPRVGVACSGGRDSTALLHVTARLALPLGIEVHALHVHHGLLPQADGWLAHLQRQCRRWTARGLPVRFHATRLSGQPGAGDSVEAWARRERQQALVAMAREAGIGIVLLAQHRRDQAETLLLQALRGAGPAGLGAMAAQREQDGVLWLRPWLDQPRTAIEAYVRRHRLRHIDDDSNADPRFLRNRLRLAVWPAFEAAFEQAEPALAQAAARQREAEAALAELAAIDAARAVDAEQRLRLAEWRQLSPARRANLLRRWLQAVAGRSAPENLLCRLFEELGGAANPASWPWPDAGGTLRRWRGTLSWLPDEAPARAGAGPTVLDLSRPGIHRLPQWGGHFAVAVGDGLSAVGLSTAELRPRNGGEQFQPHPRRPARALKKQYQANGIAPWQRQAPLVFVDGQLAFAPGLGIDARAPQARGVAGRILEWVPGGLLHRSS